MSKVHEFMKKQQPSNETVYQEYLKSFDRNITLFNESCTKLECFPKYSKHNIMLFAEISFLPYCNHEETLLMKNRSLRIGNLSSVFTPREDKYGYRYMLLHDLEKDYVVLSIRGSRTFHDWWSNFKISGDPTPDFVNAPRNSRVHRGHLRLFRECRKDITELVKKYYSLPSNMTSKNFYVVGSSLGGSLAFLVALYLKENLSSLNFSIEGLYTFNTAKIGNVEFANYAIKTIGKDNYFRVVNYNDMVPHLGVNNGSHPTIAPEYFFDEDHRLQICNYGPNGFCSSKFNCSETKVFRHQYVGHLFVSPLACKVTSIVPQEYSRSITAE